VARPPAPAEATQGLVADLRAEGLSCSARRLEDWARVGLIPRGLRRSLGRGRGTEVVYPPEMAERCRLVALRMRRGQPWQVVALCLFASGVDLPEETVRAAYRWALSVEGSSDEDELEVAERSAAQFLRTAAGRQVARLIIRHIKRSGVADGEHPEAVARSVLTNLFLVAVGGEPASDKAVIEVLAGLGLPVHELAPHDRMEAARFVATFVSAFSFDELTGVLDRASVEDLRSLLPVATAVLDLLPEPLRSLIPASVDELLPTLFVPILIQLRPLIEELASQPALPVAPTIEVSQAPATMERMPLPEGPEHLTAQARSA